MIFSNININKNKLEEFVRVLLNEEYDILSENSDEDIIIEVVENSENIKVKTKLVERTTNQTIREIEFNFEKINEKYFDQSEVMAKTSLLKLFNKEKDYKWGALIGVRPTKIVRRFINMNLSYEKIAEILENVYFVSKEKINLLLEISKRQKKYLDKETIGIYISVAFCPTKCTYCSFPAYLINGKYKERYNEYITSLFKEVEEIGKFTKDLNLKINTIYIGGGTPSILSEYEIENLLETIVKNYNLDFLKEFTFEAGRIDTLNREKLQIIKNKGVNRVSINPQTFNEKTLRKVNRYHNKEQFDDVYNISKELGLEINMDLILGLPEETTEDILYTMNKISNYDVENLTIHNLAIKNSSKLNKENYKHENILDYEKIFKKIDKITKEKRLSPYYIYRQKNSFQWGENLGYSLENFDSIYNIEMIEENKTIIGIGAGAVTKIIKTSLEKYDIKRLINPKDPLVWIDNLQEKIENKKEELRKLYKK